MPTVQNPSVEERVGLMLGLLRGVDLTSADGRAGMTSFLTELERLAPGSIRQAAAVQDRIALSLR